MSNLSIMTASLREFLTLARAERVTRAYAPPQHARVSAYFRAAESRLRAGRCITETVPAALLLREAVACYLLAAEIAHDEELSDEVLGPQDLAVAMPALAPDPARPVAHPTDDARVRAALTARDPLYFDRLSPEEAARARSALERAASMLRHRVEARSLANIRGTRWGRIATLVLIAGYVAVAAIGVVLRTPNVALHKPVIPSSVWYTPTAGQDIVDGQAGTSFGIHTQMEESPNVVIDLQDTFRIEQVKVRNRVDGWFDDCLPLVVELSVDGKSYTAIGRRDDHFDADPPWIVEAHREPARYVRVRVARKSYLALSEVEVLGKK
jgi:hypothetical protein